MQSSEPTDIDARRAEFSTLYEACASWLYSYLLSLLGRHEDAEEVLQETARVLWEKFDRFHPGTEFRAWACRVAHFKALQHREKLQRHPRLFSDSLFEALSEEAMLLADRLDARAEALAKCVEKLPSRDRHIVQDRYAPGGSIELVAQSLACSLRSAYRTLARIHETLFECVNRALAQERHS